MDNYEIKNDKGGLRIFKNGKSKEWYLSNKSSLIAMLTSKIQRESADGGTIFVQGLIPKLNEYIEVQPCPTAHKNKQDDSMGGYVCLDCRACW